MTDPDQKADLHRYLQDARETLLWKLDGLSEYDVRRPLVPTGTNLLGLVKHLAGVEMGYLGGTFGRPCPDELPFDESDPNSDMFADPSESREFITGLYRLAWAHSDATVDALPLDAVGHVPWWPADRNEVTLHHVLVRVATETSPARRPRQHRPRAHRRHGRLDPAPIQPAVRRRPVLVSPPRPGRTRRPASSGDWSFTLLGVGAHQAQRRRAARPAGGQPGISRSKPARGDPAEVSRRPGDGRLGLRPGRTAIPDTPSGAVSSHRT